MVTTTTSPFTANDVPSYHWVDPEPLVNDPPWIHTITGRRPASAAGVQTLRNRQSSDCAGIVPPPNIPSNGESGWIAGAPNSSASRTSLHGSTTSGGLNRSGPTGGAA